MTGEGLNYLNVSKIWPPREPQITFSKNYQNLERLLLQAWKELWLVLDDVSAVEIDALQLLFWVSFKGFIETFWNLLEQIQAESLQLSKDSGANLLVIQLICGNCTAALLLIGKQLRVDKSWIQHIYWQTATGQVTCLEELCSDCTGRSVGDHVKPWLWPFKVLNNICEYAIQSWSWENTTKIIWTALARPIERGNAKCVA